jgi:hypothetical protein
MLLYQKDTREKYSALTNMMINHSIVLRLLAHIRDFGPQWSSQWRCHHDTFAAHPPPRTHLNFLINDR